MRSYPKLFKAVLSIFLLTVTLPAFTAGQKETKSDASEQANNEPKTLVVYSYDSFASDWGPGPSIIEEFEKLNNVEVELHVPGDGVMVLSQLIMEKNNPKADVVIGIDNNLVSRALNEDILVEYKSPLLNTIPEELHFDKTNHLTPYDFGYFSICYNKEVVDTPPTSLEDLTDPRFANSLVLMDPRTSTPGLGFLLWTIEVYGDDYLAYWDRLKPSILTIAEGWMSGYSLMTQGEADMALSYSTSPVYHAEYEDSTQFGASKFDKGNYQHIEGMGIVKGTENEDMAKKFIDFMLSDSSQKTLAMANIMFPVVTDTELPESFNHAFHADKALLLSPDEIEKGSETWVQNWVENYGK